MINLKHLYKDQKREQKLIDICFEIAMMIHEHHDKFKNNEEVAKWVANQLEQCGFPTQQIGSSWGVLKYHD